MAWQQFILSLNDLDADRVEDILIQAGATSVTYSDAADDPVLEPGVGETPLWNETRISALFDSDAELSSLAGNLQDAFDLETPPDFVIEILEDRAWEREWLKDLAPMRFGRRLWVCPEGAAAVGDDAVAVRLDPGLAFGTGTHPTTAMCLTWLDALNLDGLRVLDYGCGSGVLAIAALKLGAASADGLDIDPQALVATRQNARANGVEVQVVADPQPLLGPYDVVLANILAGPLIDLANQISEYVKTGGRLALSGILEKQAASVRKAYEHRIAFDEHEEMQQDGQTWVFLSGRRTAS